MNCGECNTRPRAKQRPLRDAPLGLTPFDPKAPPFALTLAAPNTVLLAVNDGVLETLFAHHTPLAHGLRLVARPPEHREEQVRVDTKTVRPLLPRQLTSHPAKPELGCEGHNQPEPFPPWRSASIIATMAASCSPRVRGAAGTRGVEPDGVTRPCAAAFFSSADCVAAPCSAMAR